jgi:hypothetical protein
MTKGSSIEVAAFAAAMALHGDNGLGCNGGDLGQTTRGAWQTGRTAMDSTKFAPVTTALT